MGGQMSLMDERLRVRASQVSKVNKFNKCPKVFDNVLGIHNKRKKNTHRRTVKISPSD